MVTSHDYVVWFSSVDRDDEKYVGRKCANLGEMIQAKFPVPTGFAITTRAYHLFIRENKLDMKIKHLQETINYSDSASLHQVSAHIRNLITTSEIPEIITKEVFNYYSKMGDAFVAIRSSAAMEDSKIASFAGQQETYLNIKGEAAVLESIRQAWASLFEAKAVYYRHENKLDHLKVGISLAVQKMVESEVSGVLFTIDPITSDKSKILIEAIWGLGEYIVQGKITPDHYEVDKKSLNILSKRIVDQKNMLQKVGAENKDVKIGMFSRKRQKISDREIVELAKLSLQLEHHYYFPQDVEWAKEKGKLYIVQTRPITTISSGGKDQEEKKKKDGYAKTQNDYPILIGEPANPGIGIGCVRILKSSSNVHTVKQGEVLVAPFTTPEYVPGMKRAAAIITESGDRKSHTALISREFGIPAVVGIPQAAKKLKDGMIVTVNGKTGEIYKGSIFINRPELKKTSSRVTTNTKVYINLAEPEIAEKIAEENIDGIGLLRGEFMTAQIATHPRKLIQEHKEKLYVDTLSEGLERICRAFYPRPVFYRAIDFKTTEYRNLKGGHDFEPLESNPMLGYRGAFRYIHDAHVFKLEMEAIKRTREKKGLNNLNLMIPFVRTPAELARVKKLITSCGLRRSETFKLFLMCEVPSNVILIDDFITVGLDGVSIGSTDLTMLLLGIDRDNPEVAGEFDEQSPAVLWAFERVIRACKKRGIAVSICGQAPSLYPELVIKLVEWGVTSISVSPDSIDDIRKTIEETEKKLMNK